MERIKILAVDDEPAILSVIEGLLQETYQVLKANNGQEAIATAVDEKPDLILMDNIMPGMSGIDVVKLIRNTKNTHHIPVIMITALKESFDRIEAYRAGVDDFISKPFHPDELLARIESKIKRFKLGTQDSSKIIEFGNLKLDLTTHHVQINGKEVHLSNIDMRILHILLSKTNSIVSRDKLIEALWQDSDPTERILDIHIATLRKKMKAFSHKIETIYGQGYIIRSGKT